MQDFVQKVVERYLIFLFFDGLVLFSLIRAGHRSRRKALAVLIFTLASVIVWIDYYLIYINRLEMKMAWAVPLILLLAGVLFHRYTFPFRAHCQECGKRLSITEFLSCDENLCLKCYETKHPESVKLSKEEQIRRENEEKKKTWAGWRPNREFVIVFAFDERANVLLVDNVNMAKKPGKLAGAIGEVKGREKKDFTATRTLRKETGLECSQIDYMGRLNFEMPDMNVRFHVYVAREFSGSIRESEGKKPVWMPLKKLNYDLMSMDYPLWLPRMLRGQTVEYYARCNKEGKIYDDILDLDVEL